ncbi:MAG: ATP-binding protein [Bacteroidetes bacterium]|nr:ATP-binding protein [Bacteroidota bacterium]MCY4234211.1 ATP-binding protein [Bacteroidota bacterium]
MYSNVPSVLSELIANAWDADACEVRLTVYLDGENTKIVVMDDGCGMNADDLNEKFLTVGYQRRKKQGNDFTPNKNRKVMGRKGIGKLSVFSISENIQIYTRKNGETIGLELDQEKIKQDIENFNPHYPRPINNIPKEYQIDSVTGTIIVLSKLKKRVQTSITRNLRKRISRRFNVWSDKFRVFVNDEAVSITDRDYFAKLEYATIYGDYERSYFDHLDREGRLDNRDHTIISIDDVQDYNLRGWIGLVSESGVLQDGDDNLNKLAIFTRGKIASEDILETFRLGGLYSKFLIGELEADFLDLTSEEDIATSSRQDFIRDDHRFIALRKFVETELKFLEKRRTEYKREEGVHKAEEIPEIKKWFQELKGDARASAKKLFARINVIVTEEEHRKTMYQYGILAFEHLHHKEKLNELDNLDIHHLDVAVRLFSELDDIEASWYYQITQGRLDVIQKLIGQVEDNALEKIIQKHICSHLWLLDPSWDMATETPHMERTIKLAFNKISEKQSSKVKKGRIDILYKKSSGKHIIIELKRASVKTDTLTLLTQVEKYLDAVVDEARKAGDTDIVETICLVGSELTDWRTPELKLRSENTLQSRNTTVITYQQLIKDAEITYRNYLEKSKEKGRIRRLLDAIEQQSFQ